MCSTHFSWREIVPVPSVQLVRWLHCTHTHVNVYIYSVILYLNLYLWTYNNNEKFLVSRTFKLAMHSFAVLREDKEGEKIKKSRKKYFFMSLGNVNVLTDFWRSDSWHLNISKSNSVNMKTRCWVALSLI